MGGFNNSTGGSLRMGASFVDNASLRVVLIGLFKCSLKRGLADNSLRENTGVLRCPRRTLVVGHPVGRFWQRHILIKAGSIFFS